MTRATTVYLGLGSNLGDRRAAVDAAVAALVAGHVLRNARVSPIYETAAVSEEPQPSYLNAVVRGETSLAAQELLTACLAIEADLGRVRPVGRTKASRTIDIDVLLYGRDVIGAANLAIPHPLLSSRAFVLIPLADVAEPGLVHPVTGADLTRAAQSATVQEVRW